MFTEMDDPHQHPTAIVPHPEPSQTEWKYIPFQLGECEDIEDYTPGGFHPVHLGDVYDSRYRVVHKLGFGGFSTVWLARDELANKWVALKIVVASESPTYEARSAIAKHPSVAGSPLFAVAETRFWHDGPNGRHLCLVMPVVGPSLSDLSKLIYSRVNPNIAREVSRQAARALAFLHSHGLCHGGKLEKPAHSGVRERALIKADFTPKNIALRLADNFHSYQERDLLSLYPPAQTDPVRSYSGADDIKPHAPDYIVVTLDFCASPVTLLSSDICVIDFNRSFPAAHPPERIGIPAKYLAPEVAVGLPPSPASDVWALGCAIFRIRSGDDLFFDYDTDRPSDVLRQIVKIMGEEGMPQGWKETKFDGNGFPIPGDASAWGGQEPWQFWDVEDRRSSLRDRVRAIVDEPAGLFINSRGEVVGEPEERPAPPVFGDEAARVPYASHLREVVWKPTAVCVDGEYFWGYEEGRDVLAGFPRIKEAEVSLLMDLLSKIFVYDPAKRPTAEELVGHPWFSFTGGSG